MMLSQVFRGWNRVGRKHAMNLVLACSFAVLPATNSMAFSDLYVFGDSLSDSGQLMGAAPAFCPAAPYVGCRFSNGPVWVENIAADLGLTATPSTLGGTNYAIGGATANAILGQAASFSSSVGGVADADALYIILGGGNDFLQMLDPLAAADDIISTVLSLSAIGAENIMVANLPSLNPTFNVAFNGALASGLDSLEGMAGLNLIRFDLVALVTGIFISPGTFGFSNISERCFDGVTVCSDPDAYFFWDSVHPTAAVHRVVADGALAAIPEPGTALLLGIGLCAMAAGRRRA